MKKEELVSIIRNIVKEEVARSLPNILVEILAPKVTNGASSIISERGAVEPARAPVRQTQTKFSSNPILNKVLQETQGGVPKDPDSQLVSSEMSIPGAQVSVLDRLQSIPKEQLKEHKEVAGVLNVLNRDFRQVVRAVNAKSNNVPIPAKISFKSSDFEQQ